MCTGFILAWDRIRFLAVVKKATNCRTQSRADNYVCHLRNYQLSRTTVQHGLKQTRLLLSILIIALMMEAVITSGASFIVYQITWRNTTEESALSLL
jgi:hypothetical protein